MIRHLGVPGALPMARTVNILTRNREGNRGVYREVATTLVGYVMAATSVIRPLR